jgi:hypothetical protein
MKYDVLHAAAEVTVSKSFLLPIHSDDEFYDRASKRLQKKKEEAGLKANVETAESLLEKRDMLDKEIELVLSELKVEESRMSEAATSSTTHMESVDPLDAFMSNVSSKIGLFVSTLLWKTFKLLHGICIFSFEQRKEISTVSLTM